MIVTAYVTASLVTAGPQADRITDPRALRAAHDILRSRPGVTGVDLVTRDPVCFVVGLDDYGTAQTTTLLADLTVSESFRLVWAGDGGWKTTLVALDFAVIA